MVYTIEYKRTVRPRPYETVTIGLLEEFDEAHHKQLMHYQSVKAQVDKWCEEALEEFGEDED
ncbi:unnamed protein product [marine sediment metagenome]|uniref:Uncharacterized protein n=1 Tax=marine sediment metagenome TaxID=412755 RepID=X1JLX8_9ZZZZ